MRGGGTFIGGFAGFFLTYFFTGSFILAILGMMFGRAIGSSLSGGSFQRSFTSFSGQRQQASGPDNTFFITAFSMLGKLSAADGNISESEVETIRQFMSRELRLGYEAQSWAMRIFQEASHSTVSFDSYARQFNENFSRRIELKEIMLDILIRTAGADGNIDNKEEQMILSAVNIFGLPQSTYHNLKARYGFSSGGSSSSRSGSYQSSSSTGSADKGLYSVLGLTPDASDSDVKKSYRKKVGEFHPDKIASKGLPEEFNEFANQKFRDLQDAYDKIKTRRGF